ncbi:importin subunit alpha-4 [Anaeramoeba flamelloides]|uniref:Importin subunit alpha n=1 Tax=Anaeramoeba flamelloides TaxID=1746091 RepID=A0AAV7YN32_9EUKA|nr:importin subunit alpha-4 [Anaeramoeba flamelloides]
MSKFEKKLKKRKSRFKDRSNINKSRERRSNVTVQISKNKREEKLLKRRNITPITEGVFVEDLPTFVKGLSSKNDQILFQSLQNIRFLVSLENSPPIKEVLQSNISPTIIDFLKNSQNRLVQVEAAWILSNICSGSSSHTKYLVNLDVIPIFIDLLELNDPEIVTLALWGLANIACDSGELRDMIITNSNTIQKIIEIIEQNENNLQILKIAVWTLSNFIRTKPLLDFEKLYITIPIFASLLNHSNEQIIIDSCWALAMISMGSEEHIESIISSNCIKKLIELIYDNSTKIKIPALRTLGGIMSGTEKQIQVVIDSGFLQDYLTFFSEKQPMSVLKEACWAISNLTSGNPSQIEHLIQNGIMEHLLELMKTPIYQLKIEAYWGVNNAIYNGTKEQIHWILERDGLIRLKPFLKSRTSKLIKICLEAYLRILKVGKEFAEEKGTKINLYSETIIELGIKKSIEKLTDHRRENIVKLSTQILQNYLNEEEQEFYAQQLQTNNEQKTYNF